ncbi:reverse transcriptase family protein [Pseudomonas sp. RW3S2]|uniref:reverse transcriptase family protein n=1 Tax=Pseudomonas sp. RW3S2 TaxID=485884 RepID=UPI001647178B|nr:reverse transcriptase family protein [Pseudomonas sp. RW3S2]MBC3422317.1 RNA-directed DNA polymerase [Pseudomonas sp. RW3S2]
MDALHYPHSPIYSVSALARALGEPTERLIALAKRGSRLYRYVPQTKKDGKTPRHTYDAHEPLKTIQRKIVDRILSKISYPCYLQGGIKDVHAPRSIYANARVHAGSKSIILQDIADFFPSITVAHVRQVFSKLLGFSDEVSELLADLVTREGQVPQGASTSSYLANLVFWDIEPALAERFNAKGLRYSRFADDITVSSKTDMPQEVATLVIGSVTWMLGQKGCRPKRSKLHVRKRGQALISGDKVDAVTITGLVVDGSSPSLPKKERMAIRTAVKQLEDSARDWVGGPPLEMQKDIQRLMGRIGRLIACGHPEGLRLKARVRLVTRRGPPLEQHTQIAGNIEVHS